MASRPKRAEPRPAPRLYLITPPMADPSALARALDEAMAAAVADVAAVLLRLAEADERTLINRVKALAPSIQQLGAAVLLEGHADLVARAGADGAHLSGLDDFHAALAGLKPDRIAGVGALATRHDAMGAAEAGADYVMFGRPGENFATVHERIAWWAELFEVPCVGYAAQHDEIAPLVAAGSDFIAIDYIWSEPRSVAVALASVAQEMRLPEKTP